MYLGYHIVYIEYVASVLMVIPRTLVVGVPVSSLTNFEVISVSPISDSIKKLDIITCDLCKTARASHDVFVQGIVEVAFLKRCCDQCIKKLNGSR